MILDLDALEAVARAATPGPWSINWETDEYHAGMPDRWALSINGPEASDFADLDSADAEHMATFDPPTVLELIAKLREAREVLAGADHTAAKYWRKMREAETEMHARELHHFEEEKLRAEAEARIAAALVGHREKRGETPRHADGDHQAEIEPTRWEKYVICDYCKTTWPCKTFTALTVESENAE